MLPARLNKLPSLPGTADARARAEADAQFRAKLDANLQLTAQLPTSLDALTAAVRALMAPRAVAPEQRLIVAAQGQTVNQPVNLDPDGAWELASVLVASDQTSGTLAGTLSGVLPLPLPLTATGGTPLVFQPHLAVPVNMQVSWAVATGAGNLAVLLSFARWR